MTKQQLEAKAASYARQSERCRMYGGTLDQIRYWQDKAAVAQALANMSVSKDYEPEILLTND